MKLGTKIKTFRENGGLTQVDLANLTGISRSSIQLYEADKVEIPAKNLEKIAQALNLKVDIFFEKNLSISPVNKSVNNLSISRQLVQNSAKISDLSFTDDNAVFITALNSKVGAGESIDINGALVCDTPTKMPFSLTLFKTPPRVKNLRCMQVSGYSMIPTLYPDSWVIFELGCEFLGDGLYVINFGDSLMVKLVQRSPNGALDIISTNKEYKSYRIDAGDETSIKIIGKVLRCII
ncbi:MAG: LexA family transcriptional regulator [Campylobacter sp.]|nr:LexA family transcriptional regulator [Campylobacter sp.]MBQ7676141.1 LexA family transcriptional regulator [Campylobacter sp.]MBQ9876983.1 LexA family transcriptional regulator [Campylobacter sp.]